MSDKKTDDQTSRPQGHASGDSSGNAFGSQLPFISEVRKRDSKYRHFIELTHSSTLAAGVMLLAAIIALVIANTAAYEPFVAFWHTQISVGVGDQFVTMSFAHVINDVFMALFFLMVGLDIKYEMTAGALRNIRQALLPIVAAFGGVLMPIVIYSLFNAGGPDAGGWGVPTATDIAFALGVLSLLGDKVPSGIKVFLSTLAVADDIIAILVIAIFYGQSPDLLWLLAAAVVMAVLITLNKRHVYGLTPYVLIGGILWICIFMSGVHLTIAGVLLALTIPSGSRVNLREFNDWSGKQVKHAHVSLNPTDPVIAQSDYLETVYQLERVSHHVTPPSVRLERRLYPWIYFGVLPLFALTNADVSFAGISIGTLLASDVFHGVFFGLLLGKPIGIMLASLIVVKSGLANLPEGVSWIHMLGAAILGGVGFTMAIFVANLAFVSESTIAMAKAGILIASALAGIVGFIFLSFEAKKHPVAEPDASNAAADAPAESSESDSASVLDSTSESDSAKA